MTPEDLMQSLASGQILASLHEFETLEPHAALEFFRSLVPRLGADAGRWASDLRRSAFTAVRISEQTILEKVQKIILEGMRTGSMTMEGDVNDILDQLGMSEENPGYSQMLVRTNCLDALNQGSWNEVTEDPDLADQFEVWQYLGIKDGREGEDHRPNFSRYFPASMSFNLVRGARVFNCRCNFRWLHREEWNELQSKGARLSLEIPRELAGYQ